jgi:hypothetical protein
VREEFKAEVEFTAAGSVEDYGLQRRRQLQTNLAVLAGVPDAAVSITIAPASVVVTALVAASGEAQASNLVAKVGEKLFSPTAASALLGMPITSTPSVLKTSVTTLVRAPMPPPSAPPHPQGPPIPSPPRSPRTATADAADGQTAITVAAVASTVGGVLLLALVAVAGCACGVCAFKRTQPVSGAAAAGELQPPPSPSQLRSPEPQPPQPRSPEPQPPQPPHGPRSPEPRTPEPRTPEPHLQLPSPAALPPSRAALPMPATVVPHPPDEEALASWRTHTARAKPWASRAAHEGGSRQLASPLPPSPSPAHRPLRPSASTSPSLDLEAAWAQHHAVLEAAQDGRMQSVGCGPGPPNQVHHIQFV